MRLLDLPGGEPVRGVRYYVGLPEEACTESFPVAYWRHIELNLRRCERLWGERKEVPVQIWHGQTLPQWGWVTAMGGDDDMALRNDPLGRLFRGSSGVHPDFTGQLSGKP